MPAGRAFCYGDHIDTDVIIPARYLNDPSPEHLREHCMEDLDASFASAVHPGDIIVAGCNFGCGSSREHAPLALKASGISCVIAVSFARIFYRNAINIGLPILVCPEAACAVHPRDMLEVDFVSGRIQDLTQGTSYQADSFPPFIRDMMDCGGRLPYLRTRLKG